MHESRNRKKCWFTKWKANNEEDADSVKISSRTKKLLLMQHCSTAAVWWYVGVQAEPGLHLSSSNHHPTETKKLYFFLFTLHTLSPVVLRVKNNFLLLLLCSWTNLNFFMLFYVLRACLTKRIHWKLFFRLFLKSTL